MEKRVPPPRIVVQPEERRHVGPIRQVHDAAFGRAAEGRLVDRLRLAGALTSSLVVELDDAVIGHVAFSPVTAGELPAVVGLGPLAVVPACQGCGVGARLVEDGLLRVREGGARAVVVLGEPAYYTRFGFVPASRFGMRWEHPAPAEAFMAAELVPHALEVPGTAVIARYHAAFDDV